MAHKWQHQLSIFVFFIALVRISDARPHIERFLEVALFKDQSLMEHLATQHAMTLSDVDALLEAYVAQISAAFNQPSAGHNPINIVLVGIFNYTASSTSRTMKRALKHDDASGLNLSNDSCCMDGQQLADIDSLMGEFCQHQEWLNPSDDYRNVRHWDLALLLTSDDLYSRAEGLDSRTTMGISHVNGITYGAMNCVIVELGTQAPDSLKAQFARERAKAFAITNDDDDGNNKATTIATANDYIHNDDYEYPTRGLASAWIGAHEIAHNLGVYHDGAPFNKCAPNGSLMGSSRGRSGNTNWSACSRRSLERLLSDRMLDWPLKTTTKSSQNNAGNNKFERKPGRVYDLAYQCSFYAHNLIPAVVLSSAVLFNQSEGVVKQSVDLMMMPTVCNETIECIEPGTGRYVKIGPAWDGTTCGRSHECIAGHCVNKFESEDSSLQDNTISN